MPRYLWNDSDPIVRADVHCNPGFQSAILTTRDDLDSSAFTHIEHGLRSRGYSVIRDAHEGHAGLYVRGFKKASDLMQSLQAVEAVSTKPVQKEPLQEELNEEVKSWKQFIKENSIPLAGLTYLFADVMPIAAGIKLKTPSEAIQGVMWASTSLMLLGFGKKNPTRQVGNMYAEFEGFLQREGLDISDDQQGILAQLKTDPTLGNKLVNAIYQYPIFINNTLQGGGGAMQIRGGHVQGDAFKRAAGFGPMLGMWGGLAVPEDKYAGLSAEKRSENEAIEAAGGEAPDAFSAKFLGNPVAWVQNKPLRLSGWGPIFGNIMTAASVLFHTRHDVNNHFGLESMKYDWNPMHWARDISRGNDTLLGNSNFSLADPATKHILDRHTAAKFTIATPLFNIAANTLYNLSSKDERSVNLYDKGYLNGVLALAADIYIQVPKQQREEKLLGFAGFLAHQPDIKLSEEQIKLLVEEKIETLEKAPFTKPKSPEKTPETVVAETELHPTVQPMPAAAAQV